MQKHKYIHNYFSTRTRYLYRNQEYKVVLVSGLGRISAIVPSLILFLLLRNNPAGSTQRYYITWESGEEENQENPEK